ncbi:MAG: PKD domain-containing protein [Sphingobacteriales bacterium JAD_PAG50586_3]|nr:MAG: PKD domain-containing protein [Sphingobacteriales bacterium JAD_PAG50586_3]
MLFGNTYNNFYISSNNWIGFSPGQTSTWVTVPIPTNSGAAPRNCIMAPWQDINPGLGGQIRYAVYGTAPFRRLVISYYNVPMFSCTGLLYTSQIKIYETTNVVETHISNKPLCTGWNSGNAVHGLHNANGSQAVLVPGRNNSQWTTSNEGYRFSPNGAPAYTIDWLDANNTVVGSGPSINVTPAVTSSYTARLTYTCGNTQYTDQVQVAIPNMPNAMFGLSSNVTCQNQPITVTYNGNATPAATYNWNFNGGTVISGSGQGPYQVQWSTPGNYFVSLYVTENGCTSATGALPVTVNAVPTATFTAPASVCNPDTVTITYTGTSLPSAVYNWNFAGGTIISGTNQGPYQIYWPTTGAKNVTLDITQNGCPATQVVNTVNVYNTPTATFTAVSGVCENTATSVTYTGNATPAATYNWNLSGGTIVSGSGQGPYQLSWPNAGTYNVSLTVSENGCNSTVVTNPVVVNDVPVASFTIPATMCQPDIANIVFNGNGLVSAAYNWNFAGGTVISGTGQGPYQVQWNTPGVKAVTLSVTQNGCVSNTDTNNVTVYVVPTSTFTLATSSCEDVDLPVTYTGNATTAATYNWNFNGGSVTSGSGQGPYQVQWNPGTYNVTLSVSENGCNSTTQTMPISVYQIPTSFFTVISPVCQNQPTTIQYTGNATNNGTFNWDFDNGTVQSGNGVGPYYVVWSAPGTKNITLDVTENGCSSVQTIESVLVDTVPNVDAGVDVEFCSGFNATIGSAGTVGFSYTWAPTTGISDPYSSNPTITLTNNTTAPVVYQYVLIANNNGLCNSYDTVYVTVKPLPTVSFPAQTDQCLGGNLFTFDPEGNFSNAATFDWNINNVQSLAYNANAVTETFAYAGTYDVSVTVTDNGCISTTYTSQVTVHDSPVVDFTGSNLSGCVPLKAQFTNLTTSASSPIVSYNWDLGPGLSTDTDPAYIYTSAGVYDIVLTATNAAGCTSVYAAFAYVNAYAVPVANFVASPEEVDLLFNPFVDITNMCTEATTFWYNFGDGFISNTANGQHQYADTGKYVITQVVANQFGCADTTTRNIIVKPSHTFYIPTAFTPNEDGLNETFKPQGYEIENFTMTIFNRWGELIFSTTDITKGWDGTYNKVMCDPGVYTWRIQYESRAMKSEGRQVKEGMVTLLR